MRSNFYYVFILIFACLMSCDSNYVFDQYKTVPDAWSKNELITFTLESPDTTDAYNLFVNIRNTNDYKFNNLFLIVEMNHPNGKVQKDTLEYRMAAPDGKLLGSGFTDIKENKLWYREGEVFNEVGEYRITIQHAMRENNSVNGIDDLEGITDIGFRIEKSTSNK